MEVCVLDDCYHLVTLDQQRPIVLDRVKDFAARLTQRDDAAREASEGLESSASDAQQGHGRGGATQAVLVVKKPQVDRHQGAGPRGLAPFSYRVRPGPVFPRARPPYRGLTSVAPL